MVRNSRQARVNDRRNHDSHNGSHVCSDCQSGVKQARVNGESGHDSVISVQCSECQSCSKQARVNGNTVSVSVWCLWWCLWSWSWCVCVCVCVCGVVWHVQNAPSFVHSKRLVWHVQNTLPFVHSKRPCVILHTSFLRLFAGLPISLNVSESAFFAICAS